MHCKWGLCTSDSRSKKSSITFWPFPKPCKDFRLLQKEPSLLAIEHNPLICSQCSKCLHWIKACKVESLTQLEQIDKNCYVCSKHFQEGGPTSEQPCPFMAGSADRVEAQETNSNKTIKNTSRGRKRLAIPDCSSQSSSTDVFFEPDFFKIECVSPAEDNPIECRQFCDAETSPRSPEYAQCSTASQCSPQHSNQMKENLFHDFNSAHCSILRDKKLALPDCSTQSSSTDVFFEPDLLTIESVPATEDKQVQCRFFCDAETSPRSPDYTQCSTASQCSPQHSNQLTGSHFYNFNLAHCSILKQKVKYADKKLVVLKMKMECLLKEYEQLEKLLMIVSKRTGVNYVQEEEQIPSKRRKVVQKPPGLCERSNNPVKVAESDFENEEFHQLTSMINSRVIDVTSENHVLPHVAECAADELIVWRNDFTETNAQIVDLTIDNCTSDESSQQFHSTDPLPRGSISDEALPLPVDETSHQHLTCSSVKLLLIIESASSSSS